jgi:hypothetical protein
MGSGIVFYFFRDLAVWRGTRSSAIASFVLIAIFRWFALSVLDQDNLKRRVLVPAPVHAPRRSRLDAAALRSTRLDPRLHPVRAGADHVTCMAEKS